MKLEAAEISKKFCGRREVNMAKYGQKAQDKIQKTMHEHKHEGKYKSKKQAIAAGLNMARKSGGKVPDNPNN